MTELQKRLTDALAAREQEIDVDPDAWQKHLDLVRARAGGASGRSVVGRWRAPALVAASVVAVGVIGGVIAQTGLVGSDPVSPAGPDSGAVTAPTSTTPREPDDSAPEGPGAAGSVAPSSVGAPAAPRQSGRAPTRTDPASASTSLPATSLQTTSHDVPPPIARPTTAPVLTTAADASSPPSARSTSVQVVELATNGDGDWSGSQQATTIDLAGLIPCGAHLPELSEISTAVTVEAGPRVGIVNSDKQALPVLAVGYAVVDDEGRIASSTGGGPALQKTTAHTLPGGRSDHQASILPTGLCTPTGDSDATTTITTTIQHRIGEPATSETGSPSFQVSLHGALPARTYSAVDVVLVGDDMEHATAYRTGPTWQFSTS